MSIEDQTGGVQDIQGGVPAGDGNPVGQGAGLHVGQEPGVKVGQ